MPWERRGSRVLTESLPSSLTLNHLVESKDALARYCLYKTLNSALHTANVLCITYHRARASLRHATRKRRPFVSDSTFGPFDLHSEGIDDLHSEAKTGWQDER
ncbi:uncharacterized protein L969DRAFT_55270 [Mixia osmundae IAM 14324]|uniref:Uncharacterized protein n=1 Tax=Mixia osmundae (strain CBS 9802 / IAM 14324 / JCM 22182 / KY 12970) TaxID=764103 RepID=G7DV51_MIXOS|nr:uncharacterized protein L969DRAFT_55270 [Mixia osmundae IAM 14324]KEI36322.1 hypothetical protein L969DRAFT_55270 [Mixia osmundae IAM 14324]GAA94461.1 hypothetical protein E5Q_01113 [Mixia osmundae IAM 14324]